MNDYDVLGVGAVVVDELLVLPEYPSEDTKIEYTQKQKQLGGPVPTALKQLSNLGLKTSFIGSLGDDENSKYIKQELINSKINISNIIEQNNKTSACAQVWINSKNSSRTIAFGAGDLENFKSSDFNKLPSCKLLHIDGREHTVIKEVIKRYRDKGTLISIDTGNFRVKTLELLSLCDIIIMPKRFSMNIQNFSINKDKKVFITDGKNGSISHFNGKTYTQKAYDVDTVDTTGAGDVHAGALLYKLIQNASIEESMDFAAKTAAYKCQFLGNKRLATIKEASFIN